MRDCPQKAWIELADGRRIRCAVAEDPQLTEEGLRRFLIEPVRELADGEQPVSVYLDQLPPWSVASVSWPGPDTAGCGTVSWFDETGFHTRPLNPEGCGQPE